MMNPSKNPRPVRPGWLPPTLVKGLRRYGVFFLALLFAFSGSALALVGLGLAPGTPQAAAEGQPVYLTDEQAGTLPATAWNFEDTPGWAEQSAAKAELDRSDQSNVSNHTGKPLGTDMFDLTGSWQSWSPTVMEQQATQNQHYISYGSGEGATAREDFAIRQFAVEDAATQGLYDVYLNVRGNVSRNITPLSLVVVVDLSSSMNQENRLSIVRDGLQRFLQTVHSSGIGDHVNIGFVSYGTGVNTSTQRAVAPFGQAYQSLVAENGLAQFIPQTISGTQWTNTEAALEEAGTMLAGEGADRQKTVLLLTDGVPSRSRRILTGQAAWQDYKLTIAAGQGQPAQEIQLYDEQGNRTGQFQAAVGSESLYYGSGTGTRVDLYRADGSLNPALIQASQLGNQTGANPTSSTNSAALTVTFNHLRAGSAQDSRAISLSLPKLQTALTVDTGSTSRYDESNTVGGTVSGAFAARNFARDPRGFPLQYDNNFYATIRQAGILRGTLGSSGIVVSPAAPDSVELHGIGIMVYGTAALSVEQSTDYFRQMVSHDSGGDYYYVNAQGGEQAAEYITAQAVRISGTVVGGSLINELGTQFSLVDGSLSTVYFRGGQRSAAVSGAGAAFYEEASRTVGLTGLNLSGQDVDGQFYPDEVQIHYRLRLLTENDSWRHDYWYQLANPDRTTFRPTSTATAYPFAVPSGRSQGKPLTVTKRWVELEDGGGVQRPAAVSLLVTRSPDSQETPWQFPQTVSGPADQQVWEASVDGARRFPLFNNQGEDFSYQVSAEEGSGSDSHYEASFDGLAATNTERQPGSKGSGDPDEPGDPDGPDPEPFAQGIELRIRKFDADFGEVLYCDHEENLLVFQLSELTGSTAGEETTVGAPVELHANNEALHNGDETMRGVLAAHVYDEQGREIEDEYEVPRVDFGKRYLLEMTVNKNGFPQLENSWTVSVPSLEDYQRGYRPRLEVRGGRTATADLLFHQCAGQTEDDGHGNCVAAPGLAPGQTDEPGGSARSASLETAAWTERSGLRTGRTEAAASGPALTASPFSAAGAVVEPISVVATASKAVTTAVLTVPSAVSKVSGGQAGAESAVATRDVMATRRVDKSGNQVGSLLPRSAEPTVMTVADEADPSATGDVRDFDFDEQAGVIGLDLESGITHSLTVHKVDGSDPSQQLDATFELSRYQPTTLPDLDSLTELADDFESVNSLSTGAGGQLTFDGLHRGSLYKLTETRAPDGYRQSQTQTLVYMDEDQQVHFYFAQEQTGRAGILRLVEAAAGSIAVADNGLGLTVSNDRETGTDPDDPSDPGDSPDPSPPGGPVGPNGQPTPSDDWSDFPGALANTGGQGVWHPLLYLGLVLLASGLMMIILVVARRVRPLRQGE